MAHAIPPELLSPEDRELFAAALEWQIGREWVRFAVTEAVVLWLPFALVVVLYVMETIAYSTVVILGIVAFMGATALVLYWLFARVRPLQRELDALRSLP